LDGRIIMTQTTTDYLFQLAAPPRERSFSAVGPGGSAGRFDDHLNQASSTAGEDVRSRGAAAPLPGASRNEERPAEQKRYAEHPVEAASNSRPKNESATSPAADSTTPAESNESAESVNGNEESTDEVKADANEPDESVDAGEAAAAGILAARSSHPTAVDQVHKRETTDPASTAKAAKEKSPSLSDPLPQHGDAGRQAKTDAAATSKAVAANIDVATEPAAVQPEVISATLDAAADSIDASQGATHSKDKRVTPTSEIDASEEAAEMETPHGTKEAIEVSPGAAEIHSEIAGPSAAVPDLSTTGSTSEEASSDDEPRRTSRNDGPPDATTAKVKTDAAPLANTIPDMAEAQATAAQDETSEQGTKPVGAKGEPAAAALMRLSRATTGAGRRAAPDEDGPRVDPARFIGRVAKAFQTAQDRGGTLHIRLSPPELGSLQLELTVKDGVMWAALQTESAAARRLLLDHLPALRDRLAEQNIRVDRFDVDVRREGAESQADARGSQQQQFQHQPEQPAPRRHAMPQQPQRQAEQPEPRAVVQTVSHTGLNLIV
jgi:flagellar hook-length control protein FliK